MTANVKESVFIKGELTVEEDLTVEGRVEGKIELKDHNLSIGPQGEVNAEIYAKSVIIAGNVIGGIYATEMCSQEPAVNFWSFITPDVE